MKALLVVSDHDRKVMEAALIRVGCDAMKVARTPDDISAADGPYDIAVVQVYHGSPYNVPRMLGTDDTVGLDAIRAIVEVFPDTPILAITDSRITGDAKLAIEAGADWFQSINWAIRVELTEFLGGQIEHAKEHRLQKRTAAA